MSEESNENKLSEVTTDSILEVIEEGGELLKIELITFVFHMWNKNF